MLRFFEWYTQDWSWSNISAIYETKYEKIKKILFTIPSLLAAGALTAANTENDDKQSFQESKDGFFDRVKAYVSDINDSQSYTLAQHSSHASHGSHGSHASHSSHSSHSSYNGVNVVDPDMKDEISTVLTRNEDSTPRQTILPSSPAITDYGSRKLKVLPGNSQAFKDTIKTLQLALATKGYDVGELNGEMHSRTIAAIYEYQSDSNFIPSGKATPETLSSLGIKV